MGIENQAPFNYKIMYNGVNISEDISKHLTSLTFTDNVSGVADDLEITVEDEDLKWCNTWYPSKGAELSLEMGYTNVTIKPNNFEIDEIELNGDKASGDLVTIKAISGGVNKALHTKRSHANENKTLGEIVRTVAARHGLTVIGTIENITIARVTQHRENDLTFLHRLALEYGYEFSIKGTKLIFLHFKDLESAPKVTTIDKTDCISWSIKDKSSQVYEKADVRSHNPNKNELVKSTSTVYQQSNNDGKQYDFLKPAGNALEVHSKTENAAQANAKSVAALHFVNSLQQTADISVLGNVSLLAGNNIELTGFGVVSGIWNILKSKHSYSKSSGYITACELKRVIPATQSGSTKTPKSIKARNNNYAVKPVTLTNADGKQYDILQTQK
jgi:hypothetical protein